MILKPYSLLKDSRDESVDVFFEKKERKIEATDADLDIDAAAFRLAKILCGN